MSDAPSNSPGRTPVEPASAARGRKLPGWLSEVVVTLAIGAVVLLVVGWMKGERQRAGGALAASPAPAFSVEGVSDGVAVGLEAFRGRPVVVAFWATWCPACREELPALDQLAREADGRFAVLAVSQEQRGLLARWSKARGLTLPIASDRTGQAFASYRVDSLPTTVIIDADGKVVSEVVGAIGYEELAEQLGKLAR